MLVLQSSKKFCPTTRVIRAKDYLLLQERKEIIESAKEKRNKLIKQAEEQIKMMKEEALSEIEKQKKEMLNENEMLCQRKQLEMLFSMLSHGIDYFSSLKTTFVQIIKSLFLKILGECPTDKKIMLLVTNAVKNIPEGKLLHISVCPDQMSVVQENLEALKKAQPALKRIEVIADKNLQPDECTLETETNIIDAGISVQLDALLKAIEANLH